MRFSIESECGFHVKNDGKSSLFYLKCLEGRVFNFRLRRLNTGDIENLAGID